jgi:hypothetical protein
MDQDHDEPQRPRISPMTDRHKENVTSFAGVPSWMLVLMNKMLEETGKGTYLAKSWYFHGGVNFEPYRNFKKYFLEKILNITKYTMHPKVFLPFRTS